VVEQEVSLGAKAKPADRVCNLAADFINDHLRATNGAEDTVTESFATAFSPPHGGHALQLPQ
jgi:hypothetical protein